MKKIIVKKLSDFELDYWTAIAKFGSNNVGTRYIKSKDEYKTINLKRDKSNNVIKSSNYNPSKNWKLAGELLEELKCDLEFYGGFPEPWIAAIYHPYNLDKDYDNSLETSVSGKTPQEAICRCYVASKLGKEFDS